MKGQPSCRRCCPSPAVHRQEIEPAPSRLPTLHLSKSTLISTTLIGRSSPESSVAEPRKPLPQLSLQPDSRARGRLIPDRGTGDLTDSPSAVKTAERRFLRPALELR
jgi:hypothetical protein